MITDEMLEEETNKTIRKDKSKIDYNEILELRQHMHKASYNVIPKGYYQGSIDYIRSIKLKEGKLLMLQDIIADLDELLEKHK